MSVRVCGRAGSCRRPDEATTSSKITIPYPDCRKDILEFVHQRDQAGIVDVNPVESSMLVRPLGGLAIRDR